MGGGRTRTAKRNAADSRNSSQDGTASASASGSGTLSGSADVDSDVDMGYAPSAAAAAAAGEAAADADAAVAADAVPPSLDDYGLWDEAGVLEIVKRVGPNARVGTLKSSEVGVPKGATADDVDSLVRFVGDALKSDVKFRRPEPAAGDVTEADAPRARGALLAALASELGFARRQHAAGSELLAALHKGAGEHAAAVAAGRTSGVQARRAAAQLPREAEATRRAKRLRTEADAACASAKRQIETLGNERIEQTALLNAARLAELETRRRLDRSRLKIAAMRGEMTCPAVNVPYRRVGVDSTDAQTELRLLRNRLDMYDTEAVDWRQSLHAIHVQTSYVVRSNTLLKHEAARIKNVALAAAAHLPLTRKSAAAAAASASAPKEVQDANERPKKKPRKATPRRMTNVESAREPKVRNVAAGAEAPSVPVPETTNAAIASNNGGNETQMTDAAENTSATAPPKEQASVAQGDAA